MPIRFMLLFMLSSFLLGAQSVLDAGNDMDKLAELGEQIMHEREAEKRIHAHHAFEKLLREMLEDSKDPFSMDFSAVKTLSALLSDDKMLYVFSWMIPGPPGKESFHGFILLQKSKKDFKLIKLEDGYGNFDRPEYMMLGPGNWYGALYYQLFTVKDKRKTHYMLMGYRTIDGKVQQKLIDVVKILSGGKIQFGDQIFDTPELMDKRYEKRPYRLFFNYSARVSASFRWNEKEKMIIMDHLSPPDEQPLRDWSLYGPDFSYDGLYFEDGKWKLKEGITPKTDIPNKTPPRPPKRKREQNPPKQ